LGNSLHKGSILVKNSTHVVFSCNFTFVFPNRFKENKNTAESEMRCFEKIKAFG